MYDEVAVCAVDAWGDACCEVIQFCIQELLISQIVVYR